MEFLRPLLAKIELICQQPSMPQLSGVVGVASQPWGAGQDGWGLMGWSGYDILGIICRYWEIRNKCPFDNPYAEAIPLRTR